jgi:hypothetical protein
MSTFLLFVIITNFFFVSIIKKECFVLLYLLYIINNSWKSCGPNNSWSGLFNTNFLKCNYLHRICISFTRLLWTKKIEYISENRKDTKPETLNSWFSNLHSCPLSRSFHRFPEEKEKNIYSIYFPISLTTIEYLLYITCCKAA